MTYNIPSQRLEANFGNENPSINVPFHKGYTSHSPGTLLYQAAILFGYRGNQVTCKRATKAILKMGIGGAYRNYFKMAVYLCPSVVWSFPAEVGWTHIPRRCSKNSWSWTGWRWIAWSREESGSREVNSSGRNPAVRKLRKWSEFSIYVQTERASLSPTPPPSSTPTNTRVIRITLEKLNINYFYVIKKVGFLSNSSFVWRFY